LPLALLSGIVASAGTRRSFLMHLKIRPFSREDNAEYAAWFEDAELQRELGPAWLDDELDEVVDDQAGCMWAVQRGEELVAVMGVDYPDADHPTYAINTLAVRPDLRGTGVARDVVAGVRAQHQLKDGEYWLAFVNDGNCQAKCFFEKLGWECKGEPPANDGMYRFELRC
jgi:GNAT superfamily N-acetyltransferase